VKHRLTFVILLALLILGLAPRGSVGQVGTLPDIGLGFGPSTVQPISSGVPVFTQGDNIWLESYYNTTIDVTLQTPQGADKTGVVAVEPGQLFLLYALGGADPSGPWTLSVASSVGVTDVFVFVVSPDTSLKPAYGGARLNGNELNQTFTLPATDAYDIQLCSVGQSYENAFAFGPAGGVSGTIAVSLEGNSSQFTVSGITSPLSTWLELYSQYSYDTGGGGTTSQNLLVATTPVLSVSPPTTTQELSLVQQMPLRQGRFDLRVFDRTTGGLALHDAQFLRTVNGTWISLTECTSKLNAYSSVLSLATNLDSANTTWPRHLLTMYTMVGIESYTEIGVPGGEAAFHFIDFPDEKPLTGVAFTPFAPGLSASDWDTANSSVYLLTSSLGGSLSIRLSFSGIAAETLNVSNPGPYSSKSLSVDAGTLVVSAVQQGRPLPNATLTVGAEGSQPVIVKANAPGSASILLPPGNYAVSAAFGGVSASDAATVTPGHISTVSLDLGQQAVPVVLYLLVVLGVVGIAVNVLLWRQYLERRKMFG
jgi:hypothetical protein